MHLIGWVLLARRLPNHAYQRIVSGGKADMNGRLSRRTALKVLGTLAGSAALSVVPAGELWAAKRNPRWEKSIAQGLQWISRSQSSLGHWGGNTYPTAMAALAGTALTCAGSTTTQGPHARQIRRAVDYLMSKSRANGLIGDPTLDNRYTYGHGFSMLFLSQVLGEEEDAERREELIRTLTNAVEFSGQAQTRSGGWGYVSAKDGNNFDEGSTTITQVQGLRGCRNAGIAVPAEVIERAKQYIYSCKNPDGGISYSSTNRGSSRPAITAAALAALYNAGDYDSEHVPMMLEYCKKNLYRLGDSVRIVRTLALYLPVLLASGLPAGPGRMGTVPGPSLRSHRQRTEK